MYFYEKISEHHFNIVLDIMIRSFDNDTKMHILQNTCGPRGYDDGSLLKKCTNNYVTEIVKFNEQVIGFYCLSFQNEVGTLELFCIDPDFKNQGHGLAVFKSIEKRYPVKKWQLETPDYSVRNHYFYTNKCGFSLDKQKEIPIALLKNMINKKDFFILIDFKIRNLLF